MLTHPTLDRLQQLRRHGMARAFAELHDNADAADLARTAIQALRDPVSWRAGAEAGRKALEQHRGTAERSVELIMRARHEPGPDR